MPPSRIKGMEAMERRFLTAGYCKTGYCKTV